MPRSFTELSAQSVLFTGVSRMSSDTLLKMSIDPQIAVALTQLARQDGVPRDQISVPICPTPSASDTVLFEAATNAAQKFYLPRYRLMTQVVSGHQQYRIALEEQASNWQLVLFLEKFPAPELGETYRTAQQLPHDLSLFLRYQIAGSGAQKELPFGEVTQTESGTRGVLVVTSLAERDELYQAMTTQSYATQLIVRRSMRVAIPVDNANASLGRAGALGDSIAPATMAALPIHRRADVLAAARVGELVDINAPPILRPMMPPGGFPLPPRPLPRPPGGPVRPPPGEPRPPAVPVPQLVVKGSEEYEAGGRQWVRYLLSVTNASQYADVLFAAAPGLPPCGLNPNASRTWVDIFTQDNARLYGFCALGSARDLDNLWFAVERGQKPPDAVYVSLNDRQTGRTVRSAAVVIPPPPQVPRFIETMQALDLPISPFYFPPALHGYIFHGVTPDPGQGPGLIRWQVRWGNTFHSYFQEQARPYLFYYLPDSFKLARQPAGDHAPLLSVRIVSADGTDANTQVTLVYVAVPFVDDERLVAAAKELRPRVPSSGSEPIFQPLATNNTRFVIERPLATGATVEERPTASLALRSAIHDTLTMPLDDFQPLFDALMGQGAAIFGGKLVVKVSGWSDEEIPFKGRLDDMLGVLFDYTAVPDAESGGLKVTLTNAIESPLRIARLDAALSRGAEPVRAEVRGLSLPVASLAPHQSISFLVTAASLPSGTGELVALFDLDGVSVLLDSEALWNAMLERSSLSYYRNITVEASAVLFEPPAGRPDDQIEAIYIDFEQGGTARLSSAELRATMRVDYPINDVILHRPIDAWYSYWVAVQRKNGQVMKEAQARTGRAELFAIDVVK